MAGSKNWYNYTTNEGTIYAVALDESNTKDVNETPSVWTTSNTKDGLPRNIRVRGHYYENDEGRKIFCCCLTPAAFNAAPATIPNRLGPGGGVLTRTTERPEVRKPVPRSFDTGIVDPTGP